MDWPALAGTSIMSQVAAFTNAGPLVDPDGALFMVWGGANDIFLNPTGPAVVTAVSNLVASIAALYGFGARHFLVPNLPDLSSLPFAQSMSPQERAGLQALSIGFNNLLGAQLNGLSTLPGMDMKPFDTFVFWNAVLANPGAFGFSNATAPCLAGTPPSVSVCADPSSYVFWDTVHPTAAAHAVLGDQLAEAAAVPEPATMTLVGLGMAFVAVFARQRGTASRR